MTKEEAIDINAVAIFAKVLREAVTVGIVSHSHPDGDAAGCCYAMMNFVKAFCPALSSCNVLLENDIPESIEFIRSRSEKKNTIIFEVSPEKAQNCVKDCDTLIFMDLNTVSRTGSMAVAFQGFEGRKFLIDHHLNPDRDYFDLVFSKTAISSASELTYHILDRICRDCGIQFPSRCLTPLMTGITTDTNNFANSVFPSTLRTVAELLEKGVDRDGIIEHLYNEYHERRVRLMAHMLKDKLTILPCGAAIMTIDRHIAMEYGIQPGETDGLVNIPLSIGKVKLSILLKEDEDSFRVSIRSKRGVSANRLAKEYFNGGGHELAAGGKINKNDELCSLSNVENFVKEKTEYFLENEN